MATKELRINRQIRAREVFVIDDQNQKKGIMNFFDALALAEEAGLDLVEISPNAEPPVCKIVDYGKFRYEQEKKLKEAKKNQTIVKLREIRMQPKIDTHDLEVKTKSIAEFLAEGDKCKVTIRFHGRELAHTELGKEVLDKILEMLTEKEILYNVDSQPMMEGRNMSMLLSPFKAKKAK
ncbi:MAG: translation initiation factor IF-3 [Sphaerochaetaceae bacterium]|nr:translation initiation factor IF-3 [Sphaerochaetaceae bacterium]